MNKRYRISTKPTVYGWSVIVDFTINSFGGISDYESQPVSILWAEEEILELEQRKIHPNMSDSGAIGYRLKFVGALTASDAESAGERLAFAILRLAEKRRWGLHLEWPDSPLPCRVVDRTASTGITMQAFGSVSLHVPFATFVDELSAAFNARKAISYEILMSLELCAAARFESNLRVCFVLLVSALEALAVQEDLSKQLGALIPDLKAVIKKSDIEDAGLRQSLIGQISNLKRESVHRSMRRLLKKFDIDGADLNKIYDARSSILHEGKRIPELSLLVESIGKILKKIYQGL